MNPGMKYNARARMPRKHSKKLSRVTRSRKLKAAGEKPTIYISTDNTAGMYCVRRVLIVIPIVIIS